MSVLDRAQELLFHITTKACWEAADTFYVHPSLEKEGFIHCSRDFQVIPTANRLFTAQREALLVLAIDPQRVLHEVRYERAPDVPELFPHIYGVIPTGAVVGIVPLRRDEQGRFLALSWGE